MSEVVVVIGAGSIGQAIARRVSAGKHVVLADLHPEVKHASVESTQPSSGDAETQEQQRWLLPLGLELTAFSAALLALFASGIGWLALRRATTA
jgi:NAD(P)-dependent dehydrogenase (short-subunit alcohol dehydrogenase family)